MIYNMGHIFLCSQANLSVCFTLHTVKWTFLVYSSLSFNPCLDLCNHCRGQCAEQFCCPSNFPPELSVKPSLPGPHPLARGSLHPCRFVFPKMLYQWNHTVCSLLSLASFSQHEVFGNFPC